MTEHEQLDRISVGFDGLERSEPAVAVGLELHRRLGSSLQVVHVSDTRESHTDRESSGGLAQLLEGKRVALRERARARLADLARAAGADELVADEILTLKTGHPAHALLRHAREAAPDLFVLGPHERRGQLDFGSVARALMGHATCSLWIQPGPFRPIRRILVPTDLSEHSLSALRVGRRLAAGFGATLAALHGYVPPTFSYSSEAVEAGAATARSLIEADREADREAFETKLAEIGWRDAGHEVRWLEGMPDEVILEQAADCDVIVLGTHGRTGLAAALLGNVAYSVLRRSSVPVLAVRLPRHRWLMGS